MERIATALNIVSLSFAVMVRSAAPAQAPPLFGPAANPRAMSRLTVAVSAGPPAVVPGRPIELRFDMVPAAGIHVYAPGNPDYIPVSVTLPPQAGIQAQHPVYPPAENYVFGELKETVKVYSKPFQVRQQIVISRAAAKAAGTSITVAGSVRFQACDDKVCFPPATLPVSITLPVSAASAAAR